MRECERREEGESFPLQIFFLNAHNSQNCARLKPGGWGSGRVSHKAGRGPKCLSHCLEGTLAGNSVKSENAKTRSSRSV